MPYPKGIIPTRPDYKRWKKEHQLFEKDEYGIELLILSPDGEYVGCTKLSKDGMEPDKCWTDNLGIDRKFRRKKPATALKIGGEQNTAVYSVQRTAVQYNTAFLFLLLLKKSKKTV